MEGKSEKKSQPKQACPIRIPLIEPIKAIISKDAGDKAAIVVDILEGLVPTLPSDSIYNDLVEALTPVIDQKAKGLVGKILAYKKKPCRAGNSCKTRNCIFLHEKERRGDGMSKHPKERAEGDMVAEASAKRKKLSDTNENNEVVFNRVDETKHNPEDLKAYAAQFGKITSFKRLNAEKYLVVFDTCEEADRLVKSSEAVLGDSGIKKFYNVMDNLVRAELRKLFEEQDIMMEKMSTNFSLNLLGQLKDVNFKIKSLTMKDKAREPASTKDKDDFNQEQSLYYNCF